MVARKTVRRLLPVVVCCIATFPNILSVAHADRPFAKARQDADTPVVKHRILCNDNGLNKIFVVGEDGKIEWEFPATFSQDVWHLPNGNYLFSNVRGAQEVTPDKKVVWEYKSPDGTEVHNCQPLPGGNVMICEGGTKRLIEIGRDGQIKKEIKVECSIPSPHMQFRIARKLKNGHYLISFVGEHKVRELDKDGNILHEIPTPGDVFCAVRLPNGNTLIGCGDGHKVIEVDKTDKVVWSLDENEIPDIPLRFVAGVQRLPNGDTVVCNWGGHGHIGQQPLIFEVTKDKKVVWKLDDYDHFRTISNVQVLDVPGDVTRGQILR